MNGDDLRKLDETTLELEEIKTWINQNKHRMENNVRFLISYAIIKSCGTVEVIFKNILYSHLAQNANPEARNYLCGMILESSCNPNTGSIEKMLDSMKADWRATFSDKIKPEYNNSINLKSDLNSLVQRRNDFAHGGNATISIESVIKYFSSGKTILHILDSVVSDTNT